MKKATITISYDEEKLNALKLYLSQKGTTVEDELNKDMDALYTKSVPVGVREFIEMRNGAPPTKPAAPKQKKTKISVPSALGEAAQEKKPNE